LDNKKRTKFIEESSLPRNWEFLKLRDVCEEIYYGITARAKNSDTGLKMLRTTDIKNFKVNWADLLSCDITKKNNNISKYFLKEKDLIVARAGTIGVSVLVDRDLDNIIFGSYLIKVKLREEINTKFVHYFFQSNSYWKHLNRAQGSTVKNISLPLLKSLLIPIPPIPEQEKIAEILSTVDQSIKDVDESIAKTEKLKKALMQELLTKGIGHKEFKETEMGIIPKEWEVVKVSDIANVKGGKRLPKGKSLVDFKTSYPYIRVVDFKNMSIDSTNIKFLLPEIYRKIKNYTISYNDIYISIAGSVGLAGLVPFKLDGANLTENSAKLCDLQRVSKEFLVYILNSSMVKKQIHGFIGKAQQPKLALFRIEKIKILLPYIPEQNKIAEILSTVDERIKLIKDKRKKLERVKKGLMNDLLTGRRRVKVEA